jgi:hypothetical protein
MKKRILVAVISILILLIGYFIISSNSSKHPRVNANDVQSITINDKTLKMESNSEQIKKFITIYNKARAYKKSDGTTPAYIIAIELKNGEKINMAGTTQGFHYVSYGGKSYKISSQSLTMYLAILART